jgi:hypothetical protein
VINLQTAKALMRKYAVSIGKNSTSHADVACASPTACPCSDIARGRRQMIVKLAQPSNMLESCHAQERVTIRLSSCSGELVQILLRNHVFHYPTASRRLLYPAARLDSHQA